MKLEDDEVLVAVPVEIAAKVVRMKADYRRRQASGAGSAPDAAETTATAAPPPDTTPAPMPPYSREDIVRLKEGVRERGYQGVLALFDRCARDRTWVVKQAVEGPDLSPITFRNQLRSLSWLIKHLFDGRLDWPIEVRRWGTQYFYRFHPDVASWWQEAP